MAVWTCKKLTLTECFHSSLCIMCPSNPHEFKIKIDQIRMSIT